MKKIIVLGNWKSNKNIKEAKDWLEKFNQLASGKIKFKGEVILCAPFIDLPILKTSLSKIPSNLAFSLGSQNVSSFEDGPHTGEISANMLKNLVDYVMIGHSERRTNFNETYETINKKIKICQDNGLKTTVCISNLEQLESIVRKFPSYDNLILYEPISAIGSGKTENPDVSNEFAGKIKKYLKNAKVLYGGSVKGENVKNIVNKEFIDGVGVGGASLDPQSFWEILKNA